MPAATDFRTIADALAAAGLEIAGDTSRTGTERATLLRDVALSGKAAMEAAQAASISTNDVERALTGLADELAEAGYLDDARTLSIEDLLKVFLHAAVDMKATGRRQAALTGAYTTVGGRLLWLTQAQETAKDPAATRVAAASRQALTAAAALLEQAGISIAVEPRSSS